MAAGEPKVGWGEPPGVGDGGNWWWRAGGLGVGGGLYSLGGGYLAYSGWSF